MPKFLVTCDCYGYQGRYWEKGSEVTLSDSDAPPIHFKPLEEEKKIENQADAPIAQEQPRRSKRSQ